METLFPHHATLLDGSYTRAEWNRHCYAKKFLADNHVRNGMPLTMTYIWSGPGGSQPITVTGPCTLIASTGGSAIGAIHIQHRVPHHATLSQITYLALARTTQDYRYL